VSKGAVGAVSASGKLQTIPFELKSADKLMAALANCVESVKAVGVANAGDFSKVPPKPPTAPPKSTAIAAGEPSASAKSTKLINITGTGFVISAAGHIVTNNHVISDCVGEVHGNLVGESAATLRVVSTDEMNDLKRLTLPILPVLQRVIDSTTCGDLTFFVNDWGRPFTDAGFGNWFRDRCVEAGVPGRAHGLRKAGATIAANNGATSRQLMAIFGWDTLKEAERYTRNADQKRLAEAAMHLLEASEQSGTESCPTDGPGGTISEKN
jgi:hypothetical protein